MLSDRLLTDRTVFISLRTCWPTCRGCCLLRGLLIVELVGRAVFKTGHTGYTKASLAGAHRKESATETWSFSINECIYRHLIIPSKSVFCSYLIIQVVMQTAYSAF